MWRVQKSTLNIFLNFRRIEWRTKWVSRFILSVNETIKRSDKDNHTFSFWIHFWMQILPWNRPQWCRQWIKSNHSPQYERNNVQCLSVCAGKKKPMNTRNEHVHKLEFYNEKYYYFFFVSSTSIHSIHCFAIKVPGNGYPKVDIFLNRCVFKKNRKNKMWWWQLSDCRVRVCVCDCECVHCTAQLAVNNAMNLCVSNGQIKLYFQINEIFKCMFSCPVSPLTSADNQFENESINICLIFK